MKEGEGGRGIGCLSLDRIDYVEVREDRVGSEGDFQSVSLYLSERDLQSVGITSCTNASPLLHRLSRGLFGEALGADSLLLSLGESPI